MEEERRYWISSPSFNNAPKEENSVLTILLTGLMGIYASGHIFFFPMELIGIILCKDPLLNSDLPIFLALLAVKYLYLFSLFYAVYSANKPSVLSILWNIVAFGLITAGGYFVNTKIVSVGMSSLLYTPYFLNYWGCILCGIVGIVYIILKRCALPSKVIYYHMVPSAGTMLPSYTMTH